MDNPDFPQTEAQWAYKQNQTAWGWNMQNPTEIIVLLTELNNDFKNL